MSRLEIVEIVGVIQEWAEKNDIETSPHNEVELAIQIYNTFLREKES